MIRPHRIQDGGKVAGLADWDEDDWGHLGCKRTTCVYCGRQALSYEDDRMFDYCGHMTNIKVPMKDGSVSYACVGICQLNSSRRILMLIFWRRRKSMQGII